MDSNTKFKLFTNIAKKVNYDKEAGKFNCGVNGHSIGWKNSRGYMQIVRRVAGKTESILLHHLAWFIVHDSLDFESIDHINHCKEDNSIGNLRVSNASENQKNRTRNRNNTSGVAGVVWNKKASKWMAQCGLHGKNVYLGLFNEISVAKEAVLCFRRDHGFHVNHGVKP